MRWWGELKNVLMRSVHTSHAFNFQDMWKWKSARSTTSQKAIYVPENFSDSILHDPATTVADPGEGPGGAGLPSPPLFLDQTEARSPEKIYLGDHPPPSYLRDWMTAPPPPYLKVWIRHCTTSTSLGTNCILSWPHAINLRRRRVGVTDL